MAAKPGRELEDRHSRARELLQKFTNDWGGGIEDADELADYRYAVVVERQEDEWIHGTDDLSDVADYALTCLVDPEYDVEWIEGVYDLDTGERIPFARTVVVTVEVDGHTYTASTPKEPGA